MATGKRKGKEIVTVVEVEEEYLGYNPSMEKGKNAKSVEEGEDSKRKKGKEKVIVVEEEYETEEEDENEQYEDWCFICKEGGELILCEHRGCCKVYHANCVGLDDSVMNSETNWTCVRHECNKCHKVPKHHCYCCTFAACGNCLATDEITLLRGKKGLCDQCFQLVMTLDADEGYDSDGNKADLYDRGTYECLFYEYWAIVKETERLTVEDVRTAETRKRANQNSISSSKSKKTVKQKKHNQVILSDSDWDDNSDATEEERKSSSGVFDYVGWGSKPLVNFLSSLGKDTTKEISPEDVNAIILDYVQKNKLLDPKNKRKILCDQRLRSVFKKKTIEKNNIYDLLESHLASNLGPSEDDVFYGNEAKSSVRGQKRKGKTSCKRKWWKIEESSSDVENEMAIIPYEGSCVTSSDINFGKKEPVNCFQESIFASIVPENIKLVYLRRSLIEEFLNEPDTFEAKVVGCFVKVKTGLCEVDNRIDKLSQVAGVKKSAELADCQSEILLTLHDSPVDVCISKLSDIRFKEEEVMELREKIEKGYHPEPTVAELEQKAIYLHEDITKHWIKNELFGLQKLIDRTNEKGWRDQLEKHLDARELLMKPSEQQRLLDQKPKVIAKMVPVSKKSYFSSHT